MGNDKVVNGLVWFMIILGTMLLGLVPVMVVEAFSTGEFKMSYLGTLVQSVIIGLSSLTVLILRIKEIKKKRAQKKAFD